MTSSPPRLQPDADRQLWLAGAAFGLACALHTVDHLRRGQGSITDALYWAGNFALVAEIVTVTLVLTRHRLAPLVAVCTAMPLALGFAAAHWLPEWSDLSDPIWEVDRLPWLSAVASSTEILSALWLAVAGWRVVSRRGLDTFAWSTRPPSGG